MQSIPLDGYMWEYLNNSNIIGRLYYTHVLHGFRECHSVSIPSSIDEYYRGLPKKRRYNLLRQERQLEEHMGGPLSIFVVEEPEDLPELFRSIDALGLPSNNTALLSQRQYLSAARHKILRCHILKVGTAVIGIAVGMKSNDTCVIDRFFYDKALEKLSPGTTLWQTVLRHLIAEGVFIRVSMGYGSPVYRFRATNTIERRGRVLLFRRTFMNRCWIFTHTCYSSTLNFIKGLLYVRMGKAAWPRLRQR